MRWPYDRRPKWRRAFAFLPTRIGEEVIWLEWYWRAFCGDSYDVSLTKPEPIQ